MTTPLRAGAELYDYIVTTKENNHLLWDLNEKEIEQLCNTAIERSRSVYDQIAAAGAEGRISWDSIMGPMDEDDTVFSMCESVLTFPQHVSTSKALRDASTVAEEKLQAYSIDAGSRHDVFQAVEAFNKQHRSSLSGERARFTDRMIRHYRRMGLHLPQEQRDKIKENKAKNERSGHSVPKKSW